MKINERALNLIKESNFAGESFAKAFENLLILSKECGESIEEVEFTLTYDKDNSACIGELLPEITLRLKEKTE